MADAAVPFLRALASALLREQTPEEAAAAAHDALQPLWEGQRTLVLDVQFTGFSARGRLVGGVDPGLLRAAGALIVHRVNRIGFTPDASAADLAVLLRAAARMPGDLSADGLIGAIRRAAPRGVYLATTGSEAYRPARGGQAPLVEHGAVQSGDRAADLSPEEAEDLSAFELVDVVEPLPRTPPPEPEPTAGTPGREAGTFGGGGGGGGGADMFAFFRTADSDRMEVEAGALPGMLHVADDLARFEQIAAECTRAALSLLRDDAHEQALLLLEALREEAERSDRTRLFRDSAAQTLRRAIGPERVPRLVEHLQQPGSGRERVLRLLAFLGADAHGHLENALFRTPDPDLRRAIFRSMLSTEGGVRGVVTRSLTEPPGRVKSILELATTPGLEPEVAQRWLADASQHADPEVRAEVARHAAALGGRGGLRVLLDLLGDADRGVVRAALIGLAALGDPAAVPFLARILNDSGDEALQLGAIAALGRTGSPDALPPLLALVNKRQLISTRRVQRLKAAAVEAIGRTGAPAARDILTGIANGSDSDLATEARRAITLLG